MRPFKAQMTARRGAAMCAVPILLPAFYQAAKARTESLNSSRLGRSPAVGRLGGETNQVGIALAVTAKSRLDNPGGYK